MRPGSPSDSELIVNLIGKSAWCLRDGTSGPEVLGTHGHTPIPWASLMVASVSKRHDWGSVLTSFVVHTGFVDQHQRDAWNRMLDLVAYSSKVRPTRPNSLPPFELSTSRPTLMTHESGMDLS